MRRCLLTLALIAVSCASPAPSRVLSAAAVAAPDEFAAQTAAEILRAGGNAVDAAVAMQFSLAVTFPEAGNIGGGGFMLLWMDGQLHFLDYRETAPGKAHRDMYLDANGNVIPKKSLIGHLAAGVPGTVRGMWEAHRRFGRLPWDRVLEPSIRLAEDGFTVPDGLAKAVAAAKFDGTNFAEYFGTMQAGQRFRQPELAQTLRRIAAEGAKGFYEGRTAELIVQEMRRGGGLISADDLRSYQAKWREPVVIKWRGYTVAAAPPPSSGGVALAQLLKMKSALDAAFRGAAHNSWKYMHLIAEMEKRVFADRAHYLGDPDFVRVPVGWLTSDEYCRRRAEEVSVESISKSEEIRPGKESEQTTHFSVVDRWGNAVSNTTTLNTGFGCGVVVRGAGFLLNNEMDDFSAKPGVPNVFGVVGAEANAIHPGKRMLSSMTPAMVLRDGRLELVVGTPGGPTIFTSVFQVIVNVFDFGMDVESAVAAERFHHQLLPKDEIRIEKVSGETEVHLREMGYRLVARGKIGDVQAVRVLGSMPQPASDPRGRGMAVVIR